MADEKRWHRFRHYQGRWSNFDLIEECKKPKWCCGCEFNHPFCTELGRIEPLPALPATDGDKTP